MKRSSNRILTTHVGSLIRPQSLQEFLRSKQAGKPYDENAYQKCLTASVADVVRDQAQAGIDVVSDGEFGKSISWAQYALERLSGFERRPIKQDATNPFKRGADRTKFAEFYAELDSKEAVATTTEAICVGPIKYTGQAELQRDIDNLKAALKGVKVEEAFLPVAAPASVIPDRKNEYYKSDSELQTAIAEAMRTEYRMIVDSGFLLQLDDARSAVTFDRMVPPASFADYRRWLATQVDILNHAIEGLPADRIRYHVCWGSWPGPHTSDVPLKDIVDLILKVKVGAYVIEGANPRHEHEWQVWKNAKLAPGQVLIPGVISHATNVVEHPELVAERIVRLAKFVGRENVIAGTDCGFAQGPFYRRVHPSVMWAKLEALSAGARLASKELWSSSRVLVSRSIDHERQRAACERISDPIRSPSSRSADGGGGDRCCARDLQAQCPVSAWWPSCRFLRLHGCDRCHPLFAGVCLCERRTGKGRLYRSPTGKVPARGEADVDTRNPDQHWGFGRCDAEGGRPYSQDRPQAEAYRGRIRIPALRCIAGFAGRFSRCGMGRRAFRARAPTRQKIAERASAAEIRLGGSDRIHAGGDCSQQARHYQG